MRRPVFFVCCVATAFLMMHAPMPSSAGKKASGDKSSELDKLRGVWTLVSYFFNGNRERGEDPRCVFTFEDDRWHLTWRRDDGTDQVEQGVLRLSDGPAYPKLAALVHDRGPYKGTTTHALLQLEGDILRYTVVLLPKSERDGAVSSTMIWKRKVK